MTVGVGGEGRGFLMAFMLISAGLLLGTALACAATYVPARAAQLEWCGGLLLVSSLVALGSTLPYIPLRI
jgi:hypothetical protein